MARPRLAQPLQVDEPVTPVINSRFWSHGHVVKPQVYLPVFCSTCSTTHLLRVVSGEEPACRKCGGAASVLPSEAYGEGDVPVFERLATVVDSELRTSSSAHRVIAELSDARGRSEGPESILLRITDDLPGLQFLIPALYQMRTTPARRLEMERAMGMVLVLVRARLRRFESAIDQLGNVAARATSSRATS